ncbi:MAG: hypothetical protein AVDCRST_MAG64-2158, partial [uncultured Phycisphaerae bacterium]
RDVEVVVRTTVAPGVWSDGSGSIARFRDKMIVTTTEPIHREVEKLLALLRGDAPRADAGRGDARVRGRAAQDMTDEEIATLDPQMAKLLELKQTTRLEIENLKLSGAGPNQAAAVRAAEKLKSHDAMIAERAEWFREKYEGYRFVPNVGMAIGAALELEHRRQNPSGTPGAGAPGTPAEP